MGSEKDHKGRKKNFKKKITFGKKWRRLKKKIYRKMFEILRRLDGRKGLKKNIF